MSKPKILLFDVETAPLEVYSWGVGKQYLTIDMIKQDWSMLSWAAKWHGNSTMLYHDNRKNKNIRDDYALIKKLRDLLDEADIVITQNGNSFDIKRFNARCVIHKIQKPASFRQVDTCLIAQTKFGFTSNKLAYLTEQLCPKFKKLKHEEFPGFELWVQVLKHNKKAWDVMEKYNKHDVLGLEALYNVLQPWDNSINPNVYSDGITFECQCGSNKFEKKGFAYTSKGKYQRYRCSTCGAEVRATKNLLSKEKRDSIKVRS